MVTVTFSIKPYLAAYMYVRFKNHIDSPPNVPLSSSSHSPIHLLDTQPIYHFLHQLSVPHPPNVSWHKITAQQGFQHLGKITIRLARNRKYNFLPSPSKIWQKSKYIQLYRSRQRTCYRKRNRSGNESRTLRIPSGK